MKLLKSSGLASVFSGFGLIAALGFHTYVARAADCEMRTAMTQPDEDQASAELKEHHRHHHHGGITQFIAMSLDTLGTDDTKRPQIEKIQGELNNCMEPAANIEKKLHLTIVDGIAAGKIDNTKVDATIAELTDAATTVHDCSVIALNELHAVLSPAERSEMVGKVQAHFEVWLRVNHQEEAGGCERGGWLAEFAKELSLRPSQVKKMSVSLHMALSGVSAKYEPNKAEAHLQAFAAAFVGDSFDAKSITTNSNGYLARHGATRMAIFYETVTPMLTKKQRAMLAKHLRQHAANQPAISLN